MVGLYDVRATSRFTDKRRRLFSRRRSTFSHSYPFEAIQASTSSSIRCSAASSSSTLSQPCRPSTASASMMAARSRGGRRRAFHCSTAAITSLAVGRRCSSFSTRASRERTTRRPRSERGRPYSPYRTRSLGRLARHDSWQTSRRFSSRCRTGIGADRGQGGLSGGLPPA